MRSSATIRSVFQTVTQVVQRHVRIGGMLLVFPSLLPRFGEPSAILIAEITCPQAGRTMVAVPKTPAKVIPASVRSAQPAGTTTIRTPARAKPRSFFSLSLREMWEGRVQKLPEVDQVHVPTPVATRTKDRPRS